VPGTAGPVMLLFGPAGVGKSTVGWQLWMSILDNGAMSAFVDLDQIGAEENPMRRPRGLASVRMWPSPIPR
jgi:shikimate kinase